MGRPLRPSADSLINHAINRGNNRDAVFAQPDAEGRAVINELTLRLKFGRMFVEVPNDPNSRGGRTGPVTR